MRIIKDAELISGNEFSKHFKYGNVDVYLNKAFDEDSTKHYIIASIPNIEEVNVQHLNYPLVFDTEIERDSDFDEFDGSKVTLLVEGAIDFIKEQQEKQKDENIS